MRIDRTFVIGAGGTGGHLIPPLARLLAYHQNAEPDLIVYDGDAFDEGNATRQLVGPEQMGRNKALCMAELCAAQGLTITGKDCFADGQIMQRQFSLASCPLIVLAVDNDASRKAALEATVHLSGDFFLVSPGNADDSDGTAPIRGSVLWYGRAGEQTLGCDPSAMFPNIARPQDAIPRRGSCALLAPSAPQLIAANALSAALTLAVIQNLLDRTLPADSSTCFWDARQQFALTFS